MEQNSPATHGAKQPCYTWGKTALLSQKIPFAFAVYVRFYYTCVVTIRALLLHVRFYYTCVFSIRACSYPCIVTIRAFLLHTHCYCTCVFTIHVFLLCISLLHMRFHYTCVFPTREFLLHVHFYYSRLVTTHALSLYVRVYCAPTYLRSAQVAKETYLYGKRGLFIWQKRPVNLLAYLRYAYA